jgi:hypothetical protein
LGDLSFLLFASLLFFYWSDPVQMASVRVLPPLDHSQMEVKFPRAPDPQNYYEICFIVVSFSYMRIYSPGGLRIERGIM